MAACLCCHWVAILTWNMETTQSFLMTQSMSGEGYRTCQSNGNSAVASGSQSGNIYCKNRVWNQTSKRWSSFFIRLANLFNLYLVAISSSYRSTCAQLKRFVQALKLAANISRCWASSSKTVTVVHFIHDLALATKAFATGKTTIIHTVSSSASRLATN